MEDVKIPTCAVCGKDIGIDSEFFAITDNNSKVSHIICADCAMHTTLYDLYNKGALTMVNSPDSVIEATATVIDVVADELIPDNPMTPDEIEKFFTSSDPTFTNL